MQAIKRPQSKQHINHQNCNNEKNTYASCYIGSRLLLDVLFKGIESGRAGL